MSLIVIDESFENKRKRRIEYVIFENTTKDIYGKYFVNNQLMIKYNHLFTIETIFGKFPKLDSQ